MNLRDFFRELLTVGAYFVGVLIAVKLAKVVWGTLVGSLFVR